MRKFKFEKVMEDAITALLAQGVRCIADKPNPSDTKENCLYRKFDAQGNIVAKCILGHAIPDALYKSDMENKLAEMILNKDDRYLYSRELGEALGIHDLPIAAYQIVRERWGRMQLIHDKRATHEWGELMNLELKRAVDSVRAFDEPIPESCYVDEDCE